MYDLLVINWLCSKAC